LSRNPVASTPIPRILTNSTLKKQLEKDSQEVNEGYNALRAARKTAVNLFGPAAPKNEGKPIVPAVFVAWVRTDI
jgi:hypothetical protein